MMCMLCREKIERGNGISLRIDGYEVNVHGNPCIREVIKQHIVSKAERIRFF
ncbi:MAG: hypothetical protein ACE5K4_11435 [Candidatus Hydrothermarchaeota archaeon]